MFDLKICGYDDLIPTIALFSPTHIISAINNIEPIVGYQHLHVDVSDVVSPMDGYHHPTMQHLDQVLDFTKDLIETDRLLVHCYAGQSRSTAFAIAVLIQHGLDPEAAFDHVAQIRSVLLPNQMIIQLSDQHFELGGKLVKLIEDFRHGFLADRIRPATAPTQSDVDWMKQMMHSLR